MKKEKRFNKDSTFNFGHYLGYTVGIVFILDWKYIDWCINNVDDFCVVDLDEILEYPVMKPADLQYKNIPASELPYIDLADTWDEFMMMTTPPVKCTMSQKVINLNKARAGSKKDVREQSEYNNDVDTTHDFFQEDYRDDSIEALGGLDSIAGQMYAQDM